MLIIVFEVGCHIQASGWVVIFEQAGGLYGVLFFGIVNEYC